LGPGNACCPENSRSRGFGPCRMNAPWLWPAELHPGSDADQSPGRRHKLWVDSLAG
jgi:hypothetical protein